jgi:hypothetical protein
MARSRKTKRKGIKNDKLDRVFSQLVRNRTGWRCERCNTLYERGSQGLHCSHIFSRRAVGLRWHPSNAVAHCFSCHQWYGGNPILGAEWAENHLGNETVANLRTRFHKPVKLSAADKEVIFKRLKTMLEWMESRRAEGYMGRLDFDSPYDEDD